MWTPRAAYLSNWTLIFMDRRARDFHAPRRLVQTSLTGGYTRAHTYRGQGADDAA